MTFNSDHPRQPIGGSPSSGQAVSGDGRKPWSTPLIIVSDAKHTQAHVYTYTDGTSIHGYQYGS